MTTLHHDHAAPRRHRLAESADALARFRAMLIEWRRRRIGRAALRRLSERQLRDIGITPAEAERECTKPFWRA
jgi:uncharacterized protein YjiS (DUF1127 family)